MYSIPTISSLSFFLLITKKKNQSIQVLTCNHDKGCHSAAVDTVAEVVLESAGDLSVPVWGGGRGGCLSFCSVDEQQAGGQVLNARRTGALPLPAKETVM
jgi:hypothetical protein